MDELEKKIHFWPSKSFFIIAIFLKKIPLKNSCFPRQVFSTYLIKIPPKNRLQQVSFSTCPFGIFFLWSSMMKKSFLWFDSFIVTFFFLRQEDSSDFRILKTTKCLWDFSLINANYTKEVYWNASDADFRGERKTMKVSLSPRRSFFFFGL